MNHAITIFHNPACSTSRNTLALLRHAGLEPTIVEYLKTPPSRERLQGLIEAMGITPRELLRTKEAVYAELGLDDERWSDDDLIGQMLSHPILMNRPIVETPLGTSLCRPFETVLEILPVGPIEPFTKSNGEVLVDSGRRRTA